MIRIRATFRAHGHRFTAPDHLCAALAEALPAARHRFRHASGRGAVPAFHRMHGPAVADGAAIPCVALLEGRGGAVVGGVLGLEVETKRCEVRAEGVDVFEGGDADEFERYAHGDGEDGG